MKDAYITEIPHFDSITFQSSPNGRGVHGLIKFHNGFGASVVMTPFSYGGSKGLYELDAIDKNGELENNPSGWLSEDGVTELLKAIAERDPDYTVPVEYPAEFVATEKELDAIKVVLAACKRLNNTIIHVPDKDKSKLLNTIETLEVLL